VPEMVFVNEKENLFALSLMDIKSGKSLRDEMKPDLPDSYYDREHLLYGSADAPHKVVVFSDPRCPFCMEYVPELIKDAKANPKKFALYYYHMPLKRLHPVSETLTLAMEALQKKGRKEDALRMYALKINYRLKDPKKILDIVKKQLNIDLSTEDINRDDVKAAVKSDIEKGTRMMIHGTPTVFFDGRFDRSRILYKNILK
jgi:protein-disulfide isomerase